MLAPKHQIVADAKLRGLTGRQAGLEAGYSPKTATQNASKILARPDVIAYMAEKQAETAKASGLDHAAYIDALEADRIKAAADGDHKAVATFRKLQGEALGHINAKQAPVNVNVYAGQPREERVQRLLSSLEEVGLFLPTAQGTSPAPGAPAPLVNGISASPPSDPADG